jgi:hypothetical protein
MDGATGGIWEITETVKMVSLSFENVKIKVMVSYKCCENFENIAILNLH